MDEQLIYFGGAVKALGDGRVGGYLVRFTNEDEPDLEGEFFDARTWYGEAAESPVYYSHGLDATLGKRVLGKGALEAQDAGVWIEAQLELRDEYERAVYSLAEKGKLGWSSGTAPHLVEREQKHITRWPLGLDASLTPTPADPGNRALPLKTWAESAKGLKTLLEAEPDEGQETPSEGDAGGVTIKADSVHIEVHQNAKERLITTEDITMSEKEETTVKAPAPEPVDVEAIVKAAVTEAVEATSKAWQAKLEAEPPIKTAGFAVTPGGDEADRALKGNPFKSMGEMLKAVADAETPGPIDKRLLPLRASDKDMKGYFDMTAALPKVVGSPKDAIKAPTGLGELIPSAGGFLVGTDRDSSIMGRTYGVGNLLNRVDMVGISAGSNSMTFYAEDETSRADGSRRGGIRAYWAAEAAEKTASQPKFREMELKLYKLIGLVYATDELLADASALEGWIMQNLPEELSFTAENAIINGTGAGQPLGILNAGSLVSVAKETGQAAATIVAENISKMWARRWLGGRDYVWLVNQDVEPELDNLAYAVGTGGSLVYMPPGGLADAEYGRLKGRPVIPVEYCPTLGTVGDIMLVSLREYQMIDKGGIESASSIHVRFIYDETVFRFVYRIDGEPKWDAALTPFQGTNTVSPFVALATRS